VDRPIIDANARLAVHGNDDVRFLDLRRTLGRRKLEMDAALQHRRGHERNDQQDEHDVD
jgi:hypothetical protein